MIHIEINDEKIVDIKEKWCKWFFRANKIEEFIDILNKDDNFRKMIFPIDKEFDDWKDKFQTDKKISKEIAWREPICKYFFDDLSDGKKVVSKYKKTLKSDTKCFLIKNYENYRLSITLVKIIDIMKIEVCPYCNRNFLESYSFKDKNGIRKKYFKGDLDHHYSKNEIPALALSFYNLIPSCKVCNHEKSDSIKRTFHPYYDYEDEEYHFSIELYTEDDENNINDDMPIDNIENKRFDSTVWQGISDNFKIKLRGINKTELNECMENSNEVFRLEKSIIILNNM